MSRATPILTACIWMLLLTGTVAAANTSATLTIQDGYPQGANYSFTCETSGYNASAHDWNYGDGDKQLDITEHTTYHTYHANGHRTVRCAATGENTTETATLDINVSDAQPRVTVTTQEHYPQGPNYSVQCNVDGYEPETYDWSFGDGEKLYDVTEDTVYHTYHENGSHTITCTAYDHDTTTAATGWHTVNVTNATPLEEEEDTTIALTHTRTGDEEYRFTCQTTGHDTTTYDWEVRADGETITKTHDTTDAQLTHALTQNTTYTISCTATDDGGRTLIDHLHLDPTTAETTSADPAQTALENKTTTIIIQPGAKHDLALTTTGQTTHRIDASAHLAGNESAATIPITITLTAHTTHGTVHARLPAGTTVRSTEGWDGTILLPRLTTTPEGVENATITIELGDERRTLWFDKGVRIAFEDKAGQRIAHTRNGTTTEIDAECAQDTQTAADALTPKTACTTDDGEDRVVWTKHLTAFTAYSQPQARRDRQEPASSSSDGKTDGCRVSWECTDWSACTDGTQTRECTDTNACGQNWLAPTEERACETHAEERAPQEQQEQARAQQPSDDYAATDTSSSANTTPSDSSPAAPTGAATAQTGSAAPPLAAALIAAALIAGLAVYGRRTQLL